MSSNDYILSFDERHSQQETPSIAPKLTLVANEEEEQDEYWQGGFKRRKCLSYADYLKDLGASNAVEALDIVLRRNKLFGQRP
jgi:hypothetical protein